MHYEWHSSLLPKPVNLYDMVMYLYPRSVESFRNSFWNGGLDVFLVNNGGLELAYVDQHLQEFTDVARSLASPDATNYCQFSFWSVDLENEQCVWESK